MTPKVLEKTVPVEASTHEVWKAWTTAEGARRFFAPDARIELRLGGKYEILFDADAPEGERGSEGCRVLSYAPERMLSFSWNAPPTFEKSRREMAQWVVVLIEPAGEGRSTVRLLEYGWKDTAEGDEVYRYFDRAWGVVLARLAHSFAYGPLDWGHPFTPEGM